MTARYYRSTRDMIHTEDCSFRTGAKDWRFAEGLTMPQVSAIMLRHPWLEWCPRCGPESVRESARDTVAPPLPGPVLDLRALAKCVEQTTHDNKREACGKMASGMRAGPDGQSPYPVCAYHARGEMVALSAIVERAQSGVSMT